MLALLFSRTGAALAGVVAALGILTASHWYAYSAGAESERVASLNRSVEILRERTNVDDKIGSMDDRELCAALGGRMSDDTCI